MMMNILLSAVGRRAYLVEYFKQVVHPLGGKVYVTNTHSDATGFLVADVAEIVPSSNAPTYIDVMVSLCKKWEIKLLFSLHDWEAPVIAHARQRFLEVGTTPVMGTEALLLTCLDKYATVKAMHQLGIKCPKTTLSLADAIVQLDFPMIVKPRWGQGSLGMFKVENKEELMLAYALSEIQAQKFASVCPGIEATQPQVIIQECILGPEYGCDIVNDLDGSFRYAFVKHKFAMRSGETDAAESVHHPAIEAAAARIGAWSAHLGCMDSDWMIGKNDVPYLIELNPRFGGGYPFTHCAGVNIPQACVDWALGKEANSSLSAFKTGVRTFKEISLLTLANDA